MRQKIVTLAAILGWLVLCAVNGFSQATASREIAVTIDDLPLNGPDTSLSRMRTMTGKLVDSIRRNKVPVVGFVNESRLFGAGETDERIALLKMWVDGGVELGNHTFSHLGFKGTPIAQYEDDFVRGDTVTQTLMKSAGRRERFYRHPFLQMGDTFELEKAYEDFISARGYRIAPVTIDSLDWLILSAYRQAEDRRDEDMMRRVSDEYLRYVDVKLAYCEKTSETLFARPIKHILLLHDNELNADNFDRLIEVIKRRGYTFITVEKALTDPIYQFPPKYVATSDWLTSWAENKGIPFDPPQPADFILQIYNQATKPK
jgi:peptidoglycan/xylan/chitin deacetylase (PgdA/CDA1 family)